MNRDETLVDKYLRSLGLGEVVYEPDGKVPPVFLVGRRIAVEARRHCVGIGRGLTDCIGGPLVN
jgi:hypothetical protein